MTADSPLDAYSLIVAGVAAGLTPAVASLRVPRTAQRGGESLGSAVVYTKDGFLLTNAHVVGRAQGGTALFADGTSAPFAVVGSDPLSDLAVVRAGLARRRRLPSWGGGSSWSSASWWWPWAARSGWRVGDRGRGERARPLAADPQRRGGAADRGRDPDRRRAEPRQLRRRAGRRALPGGRHQHRGGRYRARPGGPGQRDNPPDHLRADAHGRVRRAYLGIVSVPLRSRWDAAAARPQHGLRVAEVVSGGPAERAGLRAGDLLLSAGGNPVAAAQDLQRLMFGEAIGQPLAITVMRNGALVDVIAEPSELMAA